MESEELYKQAYNHHYNGNEFDKAKEIYRKILTDFPQSKEAKYAKTQLDNIQFIFQQYEIQKESLHQSEQKNEKNKLEISKKISECYKIILTTGNVIPNKKIDFIIDIISAECVYGINILKDITMAVRDVVGGRSKSAQKILVELRKQCLTDLRSEAEMMGADAVIGVKLDFSEISGGGKSGMLLLVASGTAVS